jgi:signal transduction histidine kinase
MTAQLQNAEEMEAEMRRLERFAALGEAATTIAHEIRNPLGIIKASSQVVRMQDNALSPNSDRLIGFVIDEVDRIDRLVQDLLGYVKPKEPELAAIRVHVDIVSLVIEFARPELERRGIACEDIPPTEEPLVMADAAALHQALLNIILNAMEAMPNGGRLRVVTEHRDRKVRILVSDTGAGVPDDVRERIFEPFVTSKLRGTGLGLAKVMLVVKQHGGSVEFESEVGRGTRFILHLPALA